MWKSWNTEPPKPGDRVVILASDGCGSMVALIIDRDGDGTLGVLDAEAGDDMSILYPAYLKDAQWAHLPDDYGDMMFMHAE